MNKKFIIVWLITIFIFGVNSYAQDSKGEQTEEKTQGIIKKMPQFPGGDVAFYDYLDKNVNLPEEFNKEKYLKEHKNQFVPVTVSFTIDVDGSIIDIKIINKENEFLDKKAKEIVENMPKWEPGYQNGSPIKVEYSMPIRFNLM
jgi:Ca-activated chloride channel family protein